MSIDPVAFPGPLLSGGVASEPGRGDDAGDAVAAHRLGARAGELDRGGGGGCGRGGRAQPERRIRTLDVGGDRAVRLTAGDCFMLPRGCSPNLARDLTPLPVPAYEVPGGSGWVAWRCATAAATSWSRAPGSTRTAAEQGRCSARCRRSCISAAEDRSALRWSIERMMAELHEGRPGAPIARAPPGPSDAAPGAPASPVATGGRPGRVVPRTGGPGRSRPCTRIRASLDAGRAGGQGWPVAVGVRAALPGTGQGGADRPSQRAACRAATSHGRAGPPPPWMPPMSPIPPLTPPGPMPPLPR